ncbi:MAG: hypothetical protein WCV55_00895 [Candidatus Paceibacterota bacterium]
MTTQVIFNLDKTLKAKAMKKAQSEGIPFSSVLKFATKAFVQGKLDMELVPKEKFNKKTHKQIMTALKEMEQGKNISPMFDNVEDFIKHLNK